MVYLSTQYVQWLDDSIKEKPSSDIKKKSDLIIEIIFNKDIIIIDGKATRSNFYQEVVATLRRVSLLKPGRKLLKKLCEKSSSSIFIREYDSWQYNSKVHVLFFARKQIPYEVNGPEKFLTAVSNEICLAHELIHGLISMVRKEVDTNKNPSNLFGYDFDNLSEQVVITGIESSKESSEHWNPICENAFLRALGYPLRANHLGLYRLKMDTTPISLLSLIKVDAIGSILKYLQEHPDSINAFMIDGIWKFMPITAVILKRNRSLFDLLLQRGASLLIIDDFFGPIVASWRIEKEWGKNLLNMVIKKTATDQIATPQLVQRLLWIAASIGDPDNVFLLLQKYDSSTNEFNYDALILAASQFQHWSLAKKIFQFAKSKRFYIDVNLILKHLFEIKELHNENPQDFYFLMSLLVTSRK